MKALNALLSAWAVAVGPASAYSSLSDSSLDALPAVIESDFDIHNKAGLLAPILIPRVPGTEGSALVQQHLTSFFSQHLPEWTLSYQNSTSVTPTSKGAQVPFVNIIATRDPPWIERDGNVGRLLLVAHYDSRQQPSGFVGATDSAAPCAMLLHAAQSIDAALTKKWNVIQSEDVDVLDLEEHKGIQIVFLDGEEAFLDWTDDDSIYGARSLAAEWESTIHPAMSTYRNALRSIDLFVLLDLLGEANPRIPSYFKTTHWAYKLLATLESRLRAAGRLETQPKHPFLTEAQKADNAPWLGGAIGDDHVPFMDRGVEVLHVIPHSFPVFWHTILDNGDRLDMATVRDWALLISAFAAEWMELDGFFDAEPHDEGVSARKRAWADTDKSEL